ncbi:4-carboxy-2-hydroxymuconate-6-semialdehyde dehydrogenase [Planctomycetes bacterium MalM25]|nr:4-carboxy-2-hydroxymuconate-6-semialdehyde dehydrogenase [Planctomycetes bacterium MalM25]
MIHRRDFLAASASASALALTPSFTFAQGANDAIRLGFIGLGGRGNNLLKSFGNRKDARVTALCDVDSARLEQTASMFPSAATSIDPRGVIERDDVDAVVIATCNHWHCLAAIWACRAGKDVYVEKPLGHNLAEQEALVEVAAQTGRIVQIGTQQRSDPARMKARRWLHEEKRLGELSHVVATRSGERKPIGRRGSELPIPKTVDYKLWLGPAAREPLHRDHLHYDWHWDWNTGSGEMGNWGVHILDDLRGTALNDEAMFPSRVVSAGKRVLWDDAGETPNLHVAHFQSESLPVQLLLSNLAQPQTLGKAFGYRGPGSGYVVFGEGGYLRGQRGKYELFDADGELLDTATGSGGAEHSANFLKAVRSRSTSDLNAPVSEAYASSAWCHLANIAALQGAAEPGASGAELGAGWSDLAEALKSVAGEALPAGVVDVDPATGRVSTPLAPAASQLVTRESATAGFDPLAV